MELILKFYNEMKYNYYIYYLSTRIKKCKTVKGLINIFKNISFVYPLINNDDLTNLIINCIQIYPLSLDKIQFFSLLQQEFDNTNGIENFVTFVFWLCIVQSISESPRIGYKQD